MDDYCEDCFESHDQAFPNNYIWLTEFGHGRVDLVWFCEPPESKEFVLYTPKWWQTHCSKISHGEDLYESHVKAFVDPETRFARMIFLFEDGSLIEADEEFYRLEQEYYDHHDLCQA